MNPNQFLMALTCASFSLLAYRPGWDSAAFAIASLSSFVISQVLVPSREVPKKEDLNDVRTVLLERIEKHQLEFMEMKKIITEVVNDTKANTTKLSGLRMKVLGVE